MPPLGALLVASVEACPAAELFGWNWPDGQLLHHREAAGGFCKNFSAPCWESRVLQVCRPVALDDDSADRPCQRVSNEKVGHRIRSIASASARTPISGTRLPGSCFGSRTPG